MKIIMKLFIIIVSLFSITNSCVIQDGFCRNNEECCNGKCSINSVYGSRCNHTWKAITCMNPQSQCDEYHPCCGNATCNYNICCVNLGNFCKRDQDCCSDSICLNNKCSSCGTFYDRCSSNKPCCEGTCFRGYCRLD
jgi:hypothetical protein